MLPDTREQYASHVPALKTLIALGWQYLPPAACLQKRGDNRSVILKDELIACLQKRRFEYRGQWHALSSNAIDTIVRELSSPGLNEGLVGASERVYDRLCLGITVTEFIDGKKHAATIPVIDWDDLDNNTFQVTEELEVLSSEATHTRRPDIVCYVNGLPLVVIEAKRPEGHRVGKSMIDEGISQMLRNQNAEEIPLLFSYAQLLLAISGTEGRYGTTRTQKKFWARWNEEVFDEARFQGIKNTPLDNDSLSRLFAHRPERQRAYFERLWANEELVTEQDRLLISLLSRERLLEFVRYFILYDDRVGKIAARYPQAFGIKSLIDRINQRRPDGGRQGGVLWHTTGSGKSFTMVYLCKALLLHPSLKECRIIVVTDRLDLEHQLASTFRSGGAFGSVIATRKDGEKARVQSGKQLAKRIGQGSERILFTIINKFNSASKQTECYNPSDKLIVLVDEGHRSQGGETHQRMRQMLPNAAYIAFTGTPLLKKDKTTNKFGPIVHAYTMQRAVEDGTVAPLLYEERKPELSTNARAIDNWFDKITVGLSLPQKNDLKHKFSTKGAIYKSDNRIELIAWDIAIHFSENIKKLNKGMKGQLACDSKLSAIRYKWHLDSTGLVTSAVVISPPDSREGQQDADKKNLPEVQKWWNENVGNDEEGYERRVLEHFSTEDDPDLLIVVDKLLTGFDEPRNMVLYIDKPLKEHNLIQAIARVNRVHDEKPYGLLIDYRGILQELDTAIRKFQDLASRTQSGYDIDDIDGLYHQMSAEYKKLPALHEKLLSFFSHIESRQDREQYRKVLMPDYVEGENGESYDRNQKIRDEFYRALTQFGMCLKLALSSRSFFEDPAFNEQTLEDYKASLRFFTGLRLTARRDAQETVDYSSYEEQIRRLVDKQVVGDGIKDPEGVYVVNELGREDPEKWSKEKTRNETDLIKTRLKKTIEQELADDPYAQKMFSDLLKKAIAEVEAQFDHPLKQYALIRSFEDKVKNRDLDGTPEALRKQPRARAYYGIFRLVLGDDFTGDAAKVDKFIAEAVAMDELVKQAVIANSLNAQSMEAEIRKQLLPRLFALIGMDAAKDVIENVIHVTRIGLSRGEY